MMAADDQRPFRQIWSGLAHPFASLLQSRAICRSQCVFGLSFEEDTNHIAGLYRPAYELPPIRWIGFSIFADELLTDVMGRCWGRCRGVEVQRRNSC